MIILMLTTKEKSSLIKTFAHTIGNFIVWWGIWITKVCLIDPFWITNETIKIRQTSQSKPISVTHESDLQSWGIKKLDTEMINPDFVFSAIRLSDSSVNENLYGVFLIFIVQGLFF